MAFFKANSGDGFVRVLPHEYPLVESQEIKTGHVNRLCRQGDERILGWCRDLFSGKGHSIISIEDWMRGRVYGRLDTSGEHAGFELALKAEGHADIWITSRDSLRNCSSGKGGFHGFVVGLEPSQVQQMR